MKTVKARVLRIAVIVLCIAAVAGILLAVSNISERAWHAGMMKEGMRLVEKIEQWRAINGRFPSDLSEAGIPDDRPLYYSKWSDDEYVVWYGVGFGTSMVYDSKYKKWAMSDD